MKKYFTILLTTALMLVASGVEGFAGKKQVESDYNLRKAEEVYDKEKDVEKALELVNEQLKQTPDNIDALLLRVRIYRKKEDYARALKDINHALKVNKPKKTEVANSTLHWWKAYIYKEVGDRQKAVDSFKTAYEMAKKDDREALWNISFDYAQALCSLGDWEGADAVYKHMLSLNEADQAAMVGLARNMQIRGQYKESLELLEKCRKLSNDYGDIYKYEMIGYDKTGETEKAIDAAIDWVKRTSDTDIEKIISVLKKRPNYAEAKIKSRINEEREVTILNILLCKFYEETHQYLKAVQTYNQIEADCGHDSFLNIRRSDCYFELGLYRQAVAEISKIIDENTDWTNYARRADIYRYSGELDAAIADYAAAIEKNPSKAFSYYGMGVCYEMKGERKKAMECYNLSIEMNKDHMYPYLMRGELRMLDGDKAGAEADFKEIVQRDTIIEDGCCRHYALLFLGRAREAEEWMNKIIASDQDDDGNYYDQACLYARMGRPEDAVKALKTAFEKGYCKFAFIRLDDDLDSIRNLPEFKALVEEYEAKHTAFVKEFERKVVPEKEQTVSEIEFKRHKGGTFEIPCDINGLALQMIFDTGASDVTISSVEANFMFKNGYLSEKDIKGKRYYQIANGLQSEGTVITLHEVKIGDAILRNVDASVVKNQQAPLLLGQSAMERFGTITIDNQNNKLIIKH